MCWKMPPHITMGCDMSCFHLEVFLPSSYLVMYCNTPACFEKWTKQFTYVDFPPSSVLVSTFTHPPTPLLFLSNYFTHGAIRVCVSQYHMIQSLWAGLLLCNEIETKTSSNIEYSTQSQFFLFQWLAFAWSQECFGCLRIKKLRSQKVANKRTASDNGEISL